MRLNAFSLARSEYSVFESSASYRSSDNHFSMYFRSVDGSAPSGPCTSVNSLSLGVFNYTLSEEEGFEVESDSDY